MPRSAQILIGGRGGVLESQNPKCQDLPKFQFSGWGVFWKFKTQSDKICLNFNFGERDVLEQNSSLEVNSGIWSKISGSLACLCITDSLSHTMYVETNNISHYNNFIFCACCYHIDLFYFNGIVTINQSIKTEIALCLPEAPSQITSEIPHSTNNEWYKCSSHLPC